MTTMALKKFWVIGVSAMGVFFGANVTCGEPFTPVAPEKAASTKREGAMKPGKDAPTPADPYPLSAAGWEPEAGNGLFVSRWAEDWTGMREAGRAPPL